MKKTQILASALDHRLDDIYEEFEERYGFGPCGVYAALRREHGWGDVAICLARTSDGMEFPHYVIMQDDALIDLCNLLDEELTYSEIDLLPDDELPELVDEEVLGWMRERIKPVE